MPYKERNDQRKKTSLKVLIVEDDLYFREIIQLYLEVEGHQVELAENGIQAQKKIGQKEFDIVLSDIQMPEMNGIELIEWIKSSESLSFTDIEKLPIVLMTGFAHSMDKNKAKEMGINELLNKPFSNRDLIKAIRKTLSK